MSMHGVDEGWQWADKPSIQPEAEVLIRSGWAFSMTYGIAGQNPEWWDYLDDLTQEARIEMWRGAAKWDGSGRIEPFLMQRGRWRVLRIIKGVNQFTGHVPVEQYGLARDAPSVRRYSLDALADEIGFEVVDANDYIEQVLTGYHNGEVLEVINSLPLIWREYINLRFWQGLTEREIVARQGTDRRKTWRTKIAPDLVVRLRQLVDA